MRQIPETRYARSGDLNIAYQVVGRGDVDIVVVPGMASHLDLTWEDGGPFRSFVEGLARFARIVAFDKRGTGLSDRYLGAGSLEDRMDDVRAVMDAAGVERAAILGISEGGPMSLLFAATYPERVSSLVLYGSFARQTRAPDHAAGIPRHALERFVDLVGELWGTGQMGGSYIADDPGTEASRAWLARWERNAATPTALEALLRANAAIDVRSVLPAIRAPTLIMHCSGDPVVPAAQGRYLADHIPGARYVEIDADFHVTWRQERYAPILEAIEEFLTGEVHAPEPDRALQTIVFTDVVDSTPTAARVGDARWHELLDAHDAEVRREIARFRGREVSTTGDGFLAAFDGPARAIRCALAVVEATARMGVHVRAGVHAGECELRGDDLAGMTVHIGSRVADLAQADEVLVSGTVRDLVAGSGLAFEDRGEHELRGVPGRWRLLRALPDG